MSYPQLMRRTPILYISLGLFLAYFHRELFFGETYFDTDQLFSFFPHVFEVFGSQNPESTFLWTKKILFGFSYAESVLVPFWHFPENLLFRMLPISLATNVSYIFHFALAAGFMFLSARRLGIENEGSVFSALVFTFSGAITSNYCHFNDVTVALSFPLLFWLLDHAQEKPWSMWSLAFALALGNTMAYGHSQFVLYECMALAFYVACRWRDWAMSGNWQKISSHLFSLICAVGIAAPHLFVLAFRILQLGDDGAHAIPESFDNVRNPISLLLNLVAPFALAGDLPHVSNPKVFSLNSCLVTVFIGIGPLLLALHGWQKMQGQATRGLQRFIAGICIAAIVVFCLPLHWNGLSLLQIFERIPLLNLFHFHSRALFLFGFVAALLAGFGFQDLRRENSSTPTYFLYLLYTLLAVVTLATVFNMDLLGWTPGLWKELDSWTHGHFSHALSWGSTFSLTVTLLLGVVLLRQRKALSPIAFTSLLSLLAAGELFIFGIAYKPTIRGSSMFDPPSLANYLLGKDVRLASFVDDFFYYDRRLLSSDRRRTLAFNTNLFYGVAEIGGFVTPSQSAEFFLFFRQLNLRVPYQAEGWFRIPSTNPADLSELLQGASVTHVISPMALNDPRFRYVGKDEQLFLYEVNRPKPKIFSVTKVQSFGDKKELVAAYPRISDFAESAIAYDPENKLTGSYGRIFVSDIQETATTLSFKIRSEGAYGGYIVINEAYHPNWSAKINGKPITIFQTNGIFRGLEAPAGEHMVEMEFHNPAFAMGKAMRWISLLVLSVGFLLLYSRQCSRFS